MLTQSEFTRSSELLLILFQNCVRSQNKRITEQFISEGTLKIHLVPTPVP